MSSGPVGFLFSLALILFASKTFGLLMRKLGLPQVLGFIISGIVLGPAIWSLIFPNVDFANFLLPITQSERLKTFAEVGVIFVMFTAGLNTNLDDLKNTGLQSFLIALGGVLVPFGLGILAGFIFLPNEGIHTWMFLGTIITATSVGITVETLREMNKLKGRVGTTILSAAIIDDILGIIMLSIIMSSKNAGSNNEIDNPVLNFINPENKLWISLLWMLAYFVLAVAVGVLLSKLFKALEKKHPKTRRELIYSLVVCFLYSFVAEKIFGIAEITGAFIAGVILSTERKASNYIDRRVNTSSYLIFSPVFFASIGIGISFEGINLHLLLFGLAFVLFAIIGKILGCGALAKVFGFNACDSTKIGVGMIARGEVALIVTDKGIKAGLIDSQYIVIVVMLVLISSILAPILLKLLYKYDKNDNTAPQNLLEVKE